LPCVGVIAVIFVLGSVIFSVLVINITPIKVNGLNVVSYKGDCWIFSNQALRPGYQLTDLFQL